MVTKVRSSVSGKTDVVVVVGQSSGYRKAHRRLESVTMDLTTEGQLESVIDLTTEDHDRLLYSFRF